MKIKEIGPRGGVHPWHPFGATNRVERKVLMTAQYEIDPMCMTYNCVKLDMLSWYCLQLC